MSQNLQGFSPKIRIFTWFLCGSDGMNPRKDTQEATVWLKTVLHVYDLVVHSFSHTCDSFVFILNVYLNMGKLSKKPTLMAQQFPTKGYETSFGIF